MSRGIRLPRLEREVCALALVGAVLAAGSLQALAQDAEGAPEVAESGFSTDQLDQIAAPIALYPDSLLAQIFMASTYPLEIVEADRWRKANAKLEGADLDGALKDQAWDASVKSLCTFPTVLQRMSENLDWTQDVGDAFLGQREELMQAVQNLRKKAHDSGNLQTTKQQTVVVEKEVIVIQPADPEVIYVPTYSPTVIYAPPVPYYPVMYPPPPPPGAAFFTFAVGVAVGAAVWGNCNWHGGDVDIDVNHYNNFNQNTNINKNTNINQNTKASGKTSWNHDASHRKGVNYKNPQTAKQYGAGKGASSVSTNQARGRAPSAATSAGGGNAGGGARPSTGAAAPRAGGPAAGDARPSASAAAPKAGGQSAGGAFGGSRDSGFDRAASDRGSRSRGSGGARGGGSSGGSRGGGGRSGGGRRR